MIIAVILILSIYLACPLVGKIALLIANSIIPDPIPFVDEFIMWVGLFAHLFRLLRIAEFVANHKKLVILLSLLLVGLVVFIIAACIG